MVRFFSLWVLKLVPNPKSCLNQKHKTCVSTVFSPKRVPLPAVRRVPEDYLERLQLPLLLPAANHRTGKKNTLFCCLGTILVRIFLPKSYPSYQTRTNKYDVGTNFSMILLFFIFARIQNNFDIEKGPISIRPQLSLQVSVFEYFCTD